MAEFTVQEREVLVQHAIAKYGDEAALLERLGAVLPAKDIERTIDTLLGTQRVRRIGPDTLENNESHTELPGLPENLKPIIDGL